MPSSRDAADGPAVLAVCGPPGVGKTSVAEAAADRLGATLLRTDLVRRELFPDPTYSDAEIERVYAALYDAPASDWRPAGGSFSTAPTGRPPSGGSSRRWPPIWTCRFAFSA